MRTEVQLPRFRELERRTPVRRELALFFVNLYGRYPGERRRASEKRWRLDDFLLLLGSVLREPSLHSPHEQRSAGARPADLVRLRHFLDEGRRIALPDHVRLVHVHIAALLAEGREVRYSCWEHRVWLSARASALVHSPVQNVAPWNVSRGSFCAEALEPRFCGEEAAGVVFLASCPGARVDENGAISQIKHWCSFHSYVRDLRSREVALPERNFCPSLVGS